MLTVSLLIILGVIVGFACSLYAAWLPQRIYQYEYEWVAMAKEEPVPSADYLHLKKFASEHQWFSRESLIVIALSGLVSVWAGITVGVGGFDQLARFSDIQNFMSLRFLAWLVFCWVLVTLAAIDFKTQLLPDALTLPLVWLGLLLQLNPSTRTIGIENAVLGAVVGYMFLWLIAKGFTIMRKQDGLGHGDLKLMAAVGAWFGPLAVPVILLVGSLLALGWQVLAIVRKKAGRGDLFAFGPWLIIGTLVYLY